MIGDDFIKQSTVYKEALHEGEAMGISIGREKDILSVLATRFNQVPDRLSQRIHNLREKNGFLFDDLIKLAVTAKDIGEFERKLGKIV